MSASGQVIPPLIIFEKSLPLVSCDDGWPENWHYVATSNGYMTSELFMKWFIEVFIPNATKERPILLLFDQHKSHLSVELTKFARENQVLTASDK